jgi:hypothetical protein
MSATRRGKAPGEARVGHAVRCPMTPVQRAAWFDRGMLASALLLSALLWLALYAFVGGPLVIAVAVIGAYAIVAVGWWLHTWSDRQGSK